MATFNILEAAIRFGVPRFVNISSETVPGFFIAAFPFLGFTAAPLLGKLVADLSRGRPVPYDLVPFAAARF